jgi:CheY-like chemotaxis protein
MTYRAAVHTYDALLVDDEPALRQAMARAFNRSGFRCELAADGRHALQLMAERRFHVVVTDLSMPEMNGHRLAVELLNLPNRPVVIVVTGVTEQRLETDLRTRGIDEILFKPVDYASLAARAEALVEERAVKLARLKLAVAEVASVPPKEHSSLEASPTLATPPGELPQPVENVVCSNDLAPAAHAACPGIPPAFKPTPSPQVPTSTETDRRISRLESELARLKAKRELFRLWLVLACAGGVVTCAGGVLLGWLLGTWSK